MAFLVVLARYSGSPSTMTSIRSSSPASLKVALVVTPLESMYPPPVAPACLRSRFVLGS